jgi:hypothetical protein
MPTENTTQEKKSMSTDTLTLDDQVRRYLELTEQIEQLSMDREQVKAQLRETGVGRHETTYGVVVSVSANRRFNVDRAWAALTPEQQALCLSPDGKKVRGQLPPDLAEAFMDEVGEPRVVVK